MTKTIYILILTIIILFIIYLAIQQYKLSHIEENFNTTTDKKSDSSLRYNQDNLDIKYHDDPEKLDDYGLLSGTAYVFDKSGNKIAIPPTGLGTNTVYYEPGKYKYDSINYVPKYEDSVFLSRTANVFRGNNIASTTASIKGGICNYNKANPEELEQACQNVDANVCASTNCCVLLGGSKCVSGTENGPNKPSNYSDPLLQNRDFYYYQGKCYGNCPSY